MRGSVAQFIRYPSKDLLPCPPNADFSIFTSWRSAKLGELDFVGAEAEAGGNTGVDLIIPAGSGSLMRGVGIVLCEDEEVVWMAACLGGNDWEAVRREGQVAFVE